MPDHHDTLETLLARALLSADPWGTLISARADPSLPQDLREHLAAIDEDGLRISGLLVAKLRFERVMNGSRRAAEWFERDPESFTTAFRRYHTMQPSLEQWPGLEGQQFERWLDAGPAA